MPNDQQIDVEAIKKNLGITETQPDNQEMNYRLVVDQILGKVNLNLEKLNEFPQEV